MKTGESSPYGRLSSKYIPHTTAKRAELLQLVKVKKKHNSRQRYCVKRSQICKTATLVLLLRIN